MTKSILLVGAGILTFLAAVSAPATHASPVPSPSASELIEILRSNFVDGQQLDAQTLNDATVAGILNMIGQGAILLTDDSAAKPADESQPRPAAERLRAEIIDPEIGYIRFSEVSSETVLALDAELEKWADAKITGFVLDLRFSNGTDYKAAATVASRFVAPGQPLFTIKSSGNAAELFRSLELAPGKTPSALLSAPLLILVNRETKGAGEVLASALRSQDRAIVVGNRTAGSAAAWQDFKLGDGRVLRLATAKVLLPNPDNPEGGPAMFRPLFPNGITPDITVPMNPNIEHDVLFNAPAELTLNASLQPRLIKKGMTEADLVKVFQGQAVESNKDTADDHAQTVRDIVLQRAVDILKGIRVLLSFR
jgi:hypothetical protein